MIGSSRRRLGLGLVGLGSVMLMLVSGCSGSSPASDGMVDSGSWYVRVPWPHDGRPYESDGFVVYSDSASLEARRDVADRAERVWTEIISEMSIDTDRLGWPDGQEKIDIYAFEDRSPEWAGKAYYGGLVMSSPERRTLFGLARTSTKQYDSTLKHELVHVASEFLLRGGGLAEPPRVPVWFFEGMAEMISSGTGAGEIRGMDHFNDLTSQYGHLNPVSYESDATVEGGPNAYSEYHYPMRQLAVEYLFAESGHGAPPAAATAVLVDMAGGAQFESAFADNVGVTLDAYEEQFFELMSVYLPDRSRSAIFAPVGLPLIAVITIGLAISASVWSVRGWPPAAAVQATVTGRFAQGTRIGFALWIAVVAAFSTGVYLIGIHAVLGSWSLSTTTKLFGAVILVSYLAAATIAVTWAIRTRRNHRAMAWLLPLIAIAAAVPAAVAVIVVL